MSANDIVLTILKGEVDDGLTAIYDALKTRQNALHQIKGVVAMTMFKAGDKARLAPTISPKYLANAMVEIIKPNQKTMTVRLVDQAGARRFAGNFKCPATLLRSVD